MEKLDERQLLEKFDRLVEQGLVVYNQNYRLINLSDQGFSFQFRVLSSLANKPQAPRGDKETASLPQADQPGCRPGSDIDVSGFEVAVIGDSHLVAANKFPAARPHFLILTQDGFRRQHEPLDLQDLAAACQVLSALESRHLLLFNCGIDSGCSRMHKHMQVLPAPDPQAFALWPDEDAPVVPFRFFRRRFQDGLPTPDVLLGIYQGLVRQAGRAVNGATGRGQEVVAHNVVMNRNWLVVIPRRAAGWAGAETNAAGMLGMVWVHSEEKMEAWLERGPANVLARIGIPSNGR
ncbi:uncharacterized protein THITE_2118277 [Thermothielavioides terrestris NRRL 8126]|uniref:Uncharacterized protein n=2 Tax=Thermothielavioides terrestris TaxID=2587410 RepID=G2R9F7_THETT|nr:uncharacterized protein THITE_2118277 [Thermothielavioides terrestris NRRL 8126]AEO68698.1 hypothetical protein THITE_2118277 [Thermothielavioides terrestris NRRL 8126]